MLRIGICDDDAEIRLIFHHILERMLEKAEIESVIFEFSSGEGVLKWLGNHTGELDILFLDIELSGLNGMETAKDIRKTDDNLILVFVSGYADYVFDGYSVGAIGYLTKPVNTDKLWAVILRAVTMLQKREPETYTFQSDGMIYRVNKSDILYLQSDRRQVRVVAKRREYSFYAKLDEAEALLGEDFVRVHQRYLVRIGAIDSVGSGAVHIGGAELPVSRARQEAVMLAVAKKSLNGRGV